jgi:hypothetical protein
MGLVVSFSSGFQRPLRLGVRPCLESGGMPARLLHCGRRGMAKPARAPLLIGVSGVRRRSTWSPAESGVLLSICMHGGPVDKAPATPIGARHDLDRLKPPAITYYTRVCWHRRPISAQATQRRAGGDGVEGWGKATLWNIPNILTVLRVFSIPLLVLAFYVKAVRVRCV